MAKIKITEQQYNKLLLSQEKKLLNEDVNKVLLVIASLAGVNLTGNNKLIADKLIAKPDTILPEIKSTLENEGKLNDLIEKLKEKGLQNPEEFLAKNSEKIRDNFNQISNGIHLDFLTNTTLKELNSK